MEEVLSNRDLLTEIAAGRPRNLTFRAICKDWKAILEDIWEQEAEPNQLRFMVRLFKNKPWDRFALIENNYNRECLPGSEHVDPALSLVENLERAKGIWRENIIYQIICHSAMKDEVLVDLCGLIDEWFLMTDASTVASIFSMNRGLTWRDILNHPEIPWDWEAMST